MQSSTFIHARLFHFINARFNDWSARSPAAMVRWIAILFTAITAPIISANRCISPLCRSQSPEYPARSRGSLDFNSNEASERAIRTFLLFLLLLLSLSLSLSVVFCQISSRSVHALSRVHACLHLCVPAWHHCRQRDRWNRINWRFRFPSYCCSAWMKFQSTERSVLAAFGRRFV